MKQFIISLIRFYQTYISADSGGILRTLFGTTTVCRFTPRCSDYTIQAISRHGIIKGSLLGMKRIFRCHPWGGQGFDPVP